MSGRRCYKYILNDFIWRSKCILRQTISTIFGNREESTWFKFLQLVLIIFSCNDLISIFRKHFASKYQTMLGYSFLLVPRLYQMVIVRNSAFNQKRNSPSHFPEMNYWNLHLKARIPVIKTQYSVLKWMSVILQ